MRLTWKESAFLGYKRSPIVSQPQSKWKLNWSNVEYRPILCRRVLDAGTQTRLLPDCR